MINFIHVTILFFKLTYGENRMISAQQALDYVYRIRGSNCGYDIWETLPLQFDVTAWNRYTEPAIRTESFLSKFLELNDGALDSLTDEVFFLLVRNNMPRDSKIFGSAIAVETGVYRWCPESKRI